MHIPVLRDTILEQVVRHYDSFKKNDPKNTYVFFDGTLGAGGHMRALCRRYPTMHFFGTDIDSTALARTAQLLVAEEVQCIYTGIHANFTTVHDLQQVGIVPPLSACLLDLGYSSHQLEDDEKGMSFLKDEPLSMRIGDDAASDALTAYEILNTWSEEDIRAVLVHLGEEPLAYGITKRILRARAVAPIATTRQLADIILDEYQKKYTKKSTTHPATKTFQALRIAVNNELKNIQDGIDALYQSLVPGGMCMVITFHSIEDRIVKQAFRSYVEKDLVYLDPKKPLIPQESETFQNSRARSAKLRVYIKK